MVKEVVEGTVCGVKGGGGNRGVGGEKGGGEKLGVRMDPWDQLPGRYGWGRTEPNFLKD